MGSLKILFQLYIALLLLLGAPLDTLIDRDNGLPSWYDPGLSEDTLQAWQALQVAAEIDGLKIIIFSGYRSYADQARIYAREIKKWGDQADFYNARAGHSEHQLGTALDVAWPGLGLGVQDPRNGRLYVWLTENAHRFGFVLSYPYKTVRVWPYHNRWIPVVTDRVYEPWHIRYVGERLAQTIYNAGYLDPSSPVLPQDFFRAWP